MAIKPEQCIVCFDNETELFKCDRCSVFMCRKCKNWLQNEKNNICLQCNLKPFNEITRIQIDTGDELTPYIPILSRDENHIFCWCVSIDVHNKNFQRFAWGLTIYVLISGVAQLIIFITKIN